MKQHGSLQSSLALGEATLELSVDDVGLIHSGHIPITVIPGASLVFVWHDAVGYGLMVDSSLGGKEPALWEIDSNIGFSSLVVYGEIPPFAHEVAAPLPLVRGTRYFVSVYGAYPIYGIRSLFTDTWLNWAR